MDENKRIVDIDGVKIEVDLRTAKKIDNFKVGDTVKVLDKCSSSDKIRPGVIVDFAEFRELPTITIAVYIEPYYSSDCPTVKFIYYNKESAKDYDIVPCSVDELKVSRDGVCELFENEIAKKKKNYDDLVNQYEFFKERFLKPITNLTESEV